MEHQEMLTMVMANVAQHCVRGSIPFNDGMVNAAGWFDQEGIMMSVMFSDTSSERAIITYLAAALTDFQSKESGTPGLWWAWKLNAPLSDVEGNTVAGEEGAFVIFATMSDTELVGSYVYPLSPELQHIHSVHQADEYNEHSREVIRVLKGAIRVAQTLEDTDVWSGSATDGPSDL